MKLFQIMMTHFAGILYSLYGIFYGKGMFSISSEMLIFLLQFLIKRMLFRGELVNLFRCFEHMNFKSEKICSQK